MTRDRVAGVVVDELKDHALASAGQHVLGGVELPAGVRRRIDKPAPRRAWFLLRLEPGHAGLTEDPRQRGDRGNRGHAQNLHLVVHADRPVVQARGLQRRADAEGLLLDLVGGPGRAGLRTPAARLKGRSGAVGACPGADRIERLAGDLMLLAERGHRSAWGVIRPLRDGEADTGINGFIGSHRRSLRGRSVTTGHPGCVTDVLTQNRYRCPET